MNFFIASSSPRRIRLFKILGINFKQLRPEIDENVEESTDLSPSEIALKIAKDKIKAILEKHDFTKNDVVITADTVVSINSKILGKPVDENEARDFLRLLSSSWHEVITAVCIFNDGNLESFFETTKVKFRELTEEVIEAYIRSKEPFDKAGGYAIQGIGGLFVEKIEGDFYNVMGFPIGRVFETFLEKGWLNGTEFLHSSERATVEIWREEFEQ